MKNDLHVRKINSLIYHDSFMPMDVVNKMYFTLLFGPTSTILATRSLELEYG